jgi:thymidylate kinase
MIILVEGHRHSGKTFLMERFFEENKDPKIHYYKFQFAKYVDALGLRDQETGAGVHYFSVANVMTIFELNDTLLEDKILVFDRCVFSAYVWSIYRNRMPKERLMQEFQKILQSEIYQNCKVVYIEKDESIKLEKREKDYFGNFENADAEKRVFEEVFGEFKSEMTDSTRKNDFKRMINRFDDESIAEFNDTLNKLINSTYTF